MARMYTKKRCNSKRARSNRYRRIKKGGMNSPKVAIVFVGRIKGYEEVQDKLKHLKDKYNATVFCSLNKKNKTPYIENFCKLMEISDERLRLEKSPPPPEYTKNIRIADETRGKWGNGIGLNNTHSAFYHQQQVCKMIESYQNANAMQFDIVLFYRPDINAENELIFKNPIKKATLYVPVTEPSCDHSGVCDRCYYGDFDTMKTTLNIIDSVEDICRNKGVLYNSEALLKAHMENNKIQIEGFPYQFKLLDSRHMPHPEANIE